MRKAALLSAAAIGLLCAASGQAVAQNICYEDTEDGTIAVRLYVRTHGPLTPAAERTQFGHPVQTVYSIHGKVVWHVDPADPAGIAMAPALGTAIVANGEGTRVLFSFAIASFECSSEQSSGVPESLLCSKGQDLVLVDPLDQPLCGYFQLVPTIVPK